MANRMTTMSDYFNPLDAAFKAEQIKEARTRNRLQAMAMMEAGKKQRKGTEFEQWQASGMPAPSAFAPQQPVQQSQLLPQQEPVQEPMPLAAEGVPSVQEPMQQLPVDDMQQPVPSGVPGAVTGPVKPQEPLQPQLDQPQQPPPQLTPEQQSILRGQKKISYVMPVLNDAYKDLENKGEIVNKMFAMADKDDDMQSTFKAAGIKVSGGYNKETKSAWVTQTKDYTREELDNLADKYKEKGGAALIMASPGRYAIEFDPVSDTITKYGAAADDIGVGGLLSEKNLTPMQLEDILQNDPDPNRREQAKNILDALAQRKVEGYGARYGTLTPEALHYAAVQFLRTGRMPAMGRGARARTAIVNQAGKMAAIEGKTVDEYIVDQSSLAALRGSLNKQQRGRGALGAFIRNIDAQVSHVNELLTKASNDDRVKRSGIRMLNVPWRDFQTTIMGDANEAVLATYLKEISNEITKITSGATESIAQLPEGAREAWDKIHDPTMPISELLKLIAEIQYAGHLRIKGVDEELEFTKGLIGKKKERPAKKLEEAKMRKTEGGKKIKRTGRKDGRKVIQYEDGSIEYAK